jgi:hypothetical protein
MLRVKISQARRSTALLRSSVKSTLASCPPRYPIKLALIQCGINHRALEALMLQPIGRKSSSVTTGTRMFVDPFADGRSAMML